MAKPTLVGSTPAVVRSGFEDHNPLTISATVPATTDCLVLLISMNTYGAGSITVTATRDSNSFTVIGNIGGTYSGLDTSIAMLVLQTPDVDTGDITISPSQNIKGFTYQLLYYKDVDSIVGGTSASSSGTSMNITAGVATASDDVQLGLVVTTGSTATDWSATSPATVIFQDGTGPFDGPWTGGYTRDLTGSGQVINLTVGSANGYMYATALLRGASGATDYPIDAQDGIFTLTGSAATVLKGSAIDAATGSFAVTGANATLALGRVVNAETGTFTYTGSDAGLIADRAINAESVAYSVTGADTDLVYTTAGNFEINAEPTSFSVTGADTTLLADRALNVEAATIDVTGSDASALADREINAETTSYSVTGTDAELLQETPGVYTLNAESGSYTVAGSDAIFVYGANVSETSSGGFFEYPERRKPKVIRKYDDGYVKPDIPEKVKEVLAKVVQEVPENRQERALKALLREEKIRFRQTYLDELKKEFIRDYLIKVQAQKQEEETIVFMMMSLMN